MKSPLKIKNFSLLELLIVIAILGILSAMILPAFHETGEEAKKTAAVSEMRDIQRAFNRFAADNANLLKKTSSSTQYLEDIALYGLWPLVMQSHPRSAESKFKNFKYPDFSHDTQFGWRGQYLEFESLRKIAEPSLIFNDTTKSGGQYSDEKSNIKIPVFTDPFGGYYRILVPQPRTENGNNLPQNERLKRLVLVCTGPNQKLDTFTGSFLAPDHPDYMKNINADDIAPQQDDIIIKLLPDGF